MARMRDSRAQGERYEIGIPETGMPRADINGSTIPGAFGVSGIGEAGRQISNLGLTIMAKEDEYNRLKVDDANSRYQKAVLNLLNAPETGWFNTRMQDKAAGIVTDFDAESQKIRDQISKDMKMNKRQNGMFGVAVQKSALPFYKSTQEFEQKQFDAYRDGTYENGMTSDIETAMANPADDLAFGVAVDNMRERIEGRFGGEMPAEQVQQLVIDAASGLETDRIAAVAVKDPFAAKDMIDRSKALSNVAKQELLKSINGEIELAENQAITAEIVKKFGTKSPSAMYAYIRENYSGRQEEVLKQMSAERVNEIKATENLRDAERAKAQSANYQAMLSSDYPKTQAEVDKAFKDGLIGEEQHLVLTELGQKVYPRKTEAMSAIMKDPELKSAYLHAGPDAKTRMIFTAMGIGEDTRKEYLNMLTIEAANNSLDEDDIAWAKEMLTPSEYDGFKKLASASQKTGSLALAEANDFAKNLVNIGTNLGISDVRITRVVDKAKEEYLNRQAELPRDENYLTELQKIKTDILTKQMTEFQGMARNVSDGEMAVVQDLIGITQRSLNVYQDIFGTKEELDTSATPSVEISTPTVVSNDVTVDEPVNVPVVSADITPPVVTPVQPTVKDVEKDIEKLNTTGLNMGLATIDEIGTKVYVGKTSWGEIAEATIMNGVTTLRINGTPVPINDFIEQEKIRRGTKTSDDAGTALEDLLKAGLLGGTM